MVVKKSCDFSWPITGIAECISWTCYKSYGRYWHHIDRPGILDCARVSQTNGSSSVEQARNQRPQSLVEIYRLLTEKSDGILMYYLHF